MITSDAEFFQTALKAYCNTACTSSEEFSSDLNQHITIKRAINRYAEEGTGLHRLVNHVLIFYNCFGKNSTEMLMYKIRDEDSLGVLVPIVCFLGWHDEKVDEIKINIRTNIINDLLNLQ